MNFKPLVSEDDFRTAEAEIEAATRELARQAQAVVTAPPRPAPVAPEPARQASGDVGAEIRTRIAEAGFAARAMALFGMRSRLERVRTLNRIARTVDLGCAAGLAGRSKAFDTVSGLYTMACDPKTPADELPVILGWVQAIVVMACPSVTPAKVRAV